MQDSIPLDSPIAPSSGSDYSYMYKKMPDQIASINYYFKAANSKDVEAINCLGLIFEQGIGLDINDSNVNIEPASALIGRSEGKSNRERP